MTGLYIALAILAATTSALEFVLRRDRRRREANYRAIFLGGRWYEDGGE